MFRIELACEDEQCHHPGKILFASEYEDLGPLIAMALEGIGVGRSTHILARAIACLDEGEHGWNECGGAELVKAAQKACSLESAHDAEMEKIAQSRPTP